MTAPEGLGIWVISLRRDVERRARLVAQLRRLGLAHTWFPAIDGAAQEAELLQNADPAAYAHNMGQPILPGKLGVYASHLAVWRGFLSGPHHTALIFEDDTVLHDDFAAALDLALAHRGDWDLLRFNAIRAKWPIRQRTWGDYGLYAYLGPFTGNAAYLITREAAARLLPNLTPQTRALDHELNRFFLHDYRQMGLEPWAAHVDDGGTSTITGTGFSKVHKPAPWRRLPHYGVKASNYLRRAVWLARRGMLWPR